MAALQETGQGHEMSDLAPIVVRCHSPFRSMGRSFRPRPLAPIPELPGSSQANSSSSSGGSLAPTTTTITTGGLPTPSPTPPPEPAPSTTCYVCLAHKEPGLLVRGDPTDPRFPLASRCLDCVDKTPAGLDVGRRYELVSGEELWVCRWCGSAEALTPGWDGVEFHQGRCRREHARALWDHWWTAAVQWVLLCVLGALCFGFFGMVEAVKEDVFVLFLATAFAFVFGFLRSRRGKVYQLPLLMEVNRLTVLAGMLYYVVRAASPDPSIPMEAAASEDAPIDEALEDGSFPVSPNAAAAAILLIAWLLLHALFSCLGHTIVFYEWKMWRRSRPGMSFWRRAVEGFMFKMVVWADPFAIEQGPPPRWWRGLWRRVRERDFGRVFRGRGRGLPR